MNKLKRSEIKPYREQQLKLQCGICALCSEPVIDDAVLDHDHKTGLIRSVLHRGCNAMLGKIENNMARNRMDQERLRKWAGNIVSYISKTHTELLHPTFKIKEPKMRAQGRGKGKKPPKR
jgi:hypothetical protein